MSHNGWTYPRFNQIISNSHRTFAYLHTLSIQNSSCDTNKWLIVDFVPSDGKTRGTASSRSSIFTVLVLRVNVLVLRPSVLVMKVTVLVPSLYHQRRDFQLKMHHKAFGGWTLLPGPTGELPDLLAGFRGMAPQGKGKEGKGHPHLCQWIAGIVKLIRDIFYMQWQFYCL